MLACGACDECPRGHPLTNPACFPGGNKKTHLQTPPYPPFFPGLPVNDVSSRRQYIGKPYIEFETFEAAVDEFCSKREDERVSARQAQRDERAQLSQLRQDKQEALKQRERASQELEAQKLRYKKYYESHVEADRKARGLSRRLQTAQEQSGQNRALADQHQAAIDHHTKDLSILREELAAMKNLAASVK